MKDCWVCRDEGFVKAQTLRGESVLLCDDCDGRRRRWGERLGGSADEAVANLAFVAERPLTDEEIRYGLELAARLRLA